MVFPKLHTLEAGGGWKVWQLSGEWTLPSFLDIRLRSVSWGVDAGLLDVSAAPRGSFGKEELCLQLLPGHMCTSGLLPLLAPPSRLFPDVRTRPPSVSQLKRYHLAAHLVAIAAGPFLTLTQGVLLSVRCYFLLGNLMLQELFCAL